MHKYDIYDKLEKMPPEEFKKFMIKVSDDYEKEFKRSLVDDLIEIMEKVLKDPKSQDNVKKLDRCRKIIKILSNNNDIHAEQDPYDEENWDETRSFGIYEILYDGKRMTPNEFLQYTKNLVVGKKVSFITDENIDKLVKLTTKIKVKDVKLIDPNKIRGGVLFIDEDGESYQPSGFRVDQSKIKILD